ncbi:MAG TPA: vitamin K epoxide reductase family protein [Kofleriaceae bacterium]|nr:vitamin K epoxide reductase family protein [Kofleriaceae bacterium]
MGFAVIGLSASIASAIDYFGADPAFCGETGCATVRESAWAHPLGLPMPIVGIAFYLGALALCFLEAPRLRRGLAVAGAAWAVFLIVLQASVIGAWCKLCLVADPAAIGYAAAVLAGATVLRPSLARGLTVAPAVLATLGALALWTRHAAPEPRLPPGTPAFVEQAQVPGTATVVEVVDFECPYCRRMQERLAAAIAQARFPVRVVRKMLPLRNHPHAMPAALAYCCADAQGKGEAMAAALFAAPPDDLTPEGCEKLAASVGCDLERYRRELPRAEARVAAETEEARAAGIHALPTLYVGGEQVVGADKSTAELYALLEHAGASR